MPTPTTYTRMRVDDRVLYDRLVKRLHDLEFWLNHQFMENEGKRRDFAEKVEDQINEIFRIGVEELGLDCSPLCPREGQCVPCDE